MSFVQAHFAMISVEGTTSIRLAVSQPDILEWFGRADQPFMQLVNETNPADDQSLACALKHFQNVVLGVYQAAMLVSGGNARVSRS